MSVAVSRLPCRTPGLRPSVGEIKSTDVEVKTATIGVENNPDHEGVSLKDIKPTSDGARLARSQPLPPLFMMYWLAHFTGGGLSIEVEKILSEVHAGFFAAKWMATLMQADVVVGFRRQGYTTTNGEEVSIGDVDFLLVEWASD
eukprot:1367700-Prymnesium_polylepis.1